MKGHLLNLLRYNMWRHEKIYEFLCEMPRPEQFLFATYQCLFFNTPKATIDHILIADQYWKMRLRNQTESEEYKKLSDYWAQNSKHKFNQHWGNQFWLKHYRQDTGRLMNNYVEILNEYSDDESLRSKIKYPSSSGALREKTVKDIFTHVVNHHTHHIGQLSAAHRQYSKESDFPSLDYTYFLD